MEWDFDGTGSYAESSRIGDVDSSVQLATTHTFAKPGTYFVAVRVTSQKEGDAKAAYTLVQNLGRVRIVVR
ncbi:hypothetical protein BL253_35365 [Pseudofrankia asymbiotica]|uniref:PKD domain-containing protein n=1 Tax=Pseudofrankia asymbiotica TaxID=1834516 RepID=A0A1V2I001_9ACTN|nr:hypothetical protein BL253_35365 [Pseudofrankia asymbiotica]